MRKGYIKKQNLTLGMREQEKINTNENKFLTDFTMKENSKG